MGDSQLHEVRLRTGHMRFPSDEESVARMKRWTLNLEPEAEKKSLTPSIVVLTIWLVLMATVAGYLLLKFA